MNKAYLFGLLLLTILSYLQVQKVSAQANLSDSVKHMLTYFKSIDKNVQIQSAIGETQRLFKGSKIDTLTSEKLLDLTDLLVEFSDAKRQAVVSFAETLCQLFKELPPTGKHIHLARSLSILGDLYVEMRLFGKARPALQQSLDIYARVVGEKHPDYGSGLSYFGWMYYSMGENDSALIYYQKALAIFENGAQQHPVYSHVLNDLGSVYGNMGQFDKALAVYEKSLAIKEKTLGKGHPDYAVALFNLGLMYKNMGQYDKALSYFEASIAITRKVAGEESINYATNLNSLARLYHSMGQYDKAINLYDKALAIKKNILGEEHPQYVTILNNAALLYGDMGQYEKALQLFERCLALRKKILGEEHPYYAQSLGNLATVYTLMNQHEQARRLYEKALDIYKLKFGEEHAEYANMLVNIALSYQVSGFYDKALSGYTKAIGIFAKKGVENTDYSRALYNLATLHADARLYDKALPLFTKALGIVKDAVGEEHLQYAKILNGLGWAKQGLGDTVNSISEIVESSLINLKLLSNSLPVLSEQEKTAFLYKNAHSFDYLSSLALALKTPSALVLNQLYQNELMLKGMVLEDQRALLNSIRKSGDSSLILLYNAWLMNKSFTGKQALLPIKERIPYLDSLNEVIVKQERELSGRSVPFRTRRDLSTFSPALLSKKLSAGETAIEFVRFQVYNTKWKDSTMYAAIVLLPGDSVPKFLQLFEETQLQHLLTGKASATGIKKLYPGAVNKKGTSSYQNDLLYKLIWKPLEKYLTGVHTIYYAPAGLLNRVAFGALRSDANRLLIDKYHLNQVLSTRSLLLPASSSKKPATASLWGNIRYNFTKGAAVNEVVSRGSFVKEGATDAATSGFNFYAPDTRNMRGKEWNYLSGTRQEINNIQKLFAGAGTKITIDSGNFATEEAFKALDGRSPEVIHLATHGFFLPVKKSMFGSAAGTNENAFTIQQNPMFRSGLVLAGGNQAWKGEPAMPNREDGILTSYEISQLDLSNTKLVVLSACETALGDLQGNEGVIGLQRAFKLAGVKQMIISLWQVPDKETVQLITMFYNNWFKGQTAREALRTAQLAMKKNYSPYYWAAFILVE